MNEEDKIIQEGLKSKSKQDTLCYIGMAVLAILIAIPPIFRVVFRDVKQKVTVEDVVYLTVTCRYRFFDDDKVGMGETIILKYRNADMLNFSVEYLPEASEAAFHSSRIDEMKAVFASIKGKAEATESNAKLYYYVDLLKNPEVRQVAEFKPFLKPAVAEMDYLRNQRSMVCTKESNTVKEDNAKWEAEHKNS